MWNPPPKLARWSIASGDHVRLLQSRHGTLRRRRHGLRAANCIGRGKNVFLDMKFYDIGETVRRAVAQVARTGVRFLTVHGRDCRHARRH